MMQNVIAADYGKISQKWTNVLHDAITSSVTIKSNTDSAVDANSNFQMLSYQALCVVM